MSELTDLSERIRGCTSCTLSQGRTHAVPGEGPEDAEVMFIGEGPGFNEDQQGRPFIGQAGKLLDQLIELAGMSRKDVYITNVVKCHPPANRDPLPNEIEACSTHLTRQLELIRPRIIVTLGRYSMARFFPGKSIGAIHGRPMTANSITYMPMYHPAAALRQVSLRQATEADFRKLRDVVAEARQADTAAVTAAAQEAQPEQLRLI